MAVDLSRRFLFLLVLICGVCNAAVELPDIYRQTFEQAVANGAYPSIAVGMIDGKEQGTWFFGKRSPTAQSAFEIGAVSEVFAGLLLAQDAIAGKVRLRDTVRQLLPPGFSFADSRIGDITLEDLITHHSGLPPIPPNFFPADGEDPYADYRDADLLGFLANYHPATLQHEYNYSTLNVGLLTFLLGRAHSDAYPVVLKSQVLEPLKLAHTTFGDAPELLAGSAYAQPAKHWRYGALQGAAGLRSTMPDLMSLLQFNLSPDTAPLRSALLLARQARTSNANDGLGLGWNVRDSKNEEQNWPLVWRASETGGFSAFIGFRNDRRKALVLLANSAEDLSVLGVAWLSEESPAPAPRGAHPPPASAYADYAGLYQITNGNEITVRQIGADLSIQILGQPPWRLRGYENDGFIANAGGVGVSFVRDIDHISGLVLRLGSDHVSANRLSARAPQLAHVPITMDRTALARYAGLYQLDANTLVRIDAAADGLTLQMTGTPRSPIKPYAPDRFADADNAYDVIFERDKSGELSGLTLNLAGADRRATLIHWR